MEFIRSFRGHAPAAPSNHSREEVSRTSYLRGLADPTQARYGRWIELVNRVRLGEPSAMVELYALFSESIRYSLYRQLLPQDLDDMLHDAFVIVVEAIRRGLIREPARLMGFVKTVMRRQLAAHIQDAVSGRSQQTPLDPARSLPTAEPDPEQALLSLQRRELVVNALKTVSARDRQILVRFYLLEQTKDEICDQMGLTKTQFRLLKSRAKARFVKAGQRRMSRAAS
jgi:RNA polymerase sigma-70 factor (ECF subfamily)